MLRPVLIACLAAGTTVLLLSAPSPDVRPVTAGPVNPQDIRIELNGPGGRQVRFGLPDFVLAPGDLELKSAAVMVADVLWNDLDFEEEFYMIRRDVSASVPVTDVVADLPVDRWAELGADYVVVGSAQRAGPKLTVEIRLVGVRGNAARKVMNGEGVAYNCVITSPRACAHAISDSLHKLHGIDGVAQTRLAFVSDRGGDMMAGALSRGSKEIYISDYDGANQQPVTANRTLNISPTWSPDGNLLAYVSYPATGGADIYVKSIYEAKQAWRPALGGMPNYFPAFSPDGTKIAFASSRDTPGLYQLYVVDRDGKTPPRRITSSKSADLVPTWSPDGTKIAFASDRTGQGSPRIYVTSADGVGLEVLPCSAKCDRPSWSPTGELIAFTCGPDSGHDICTINLRTREVATLTDGTGNNEQPYFAPNGRHIVFSTTRYGKEQIAMIDLKGKLQRRITEVGNNSYPSWSHARR